MHNDELPAYYNQRKGTLAISKGTYNGVQVLSWDAVKACLGENCPCVDLCEFKVGAARNTKCRVQMNYVVEIFKQFIQQYPDIEEFKLTQFGTMLMPLYTTLAWLQINEVAVRQPVYLTDKGTRSAHPIYKEIRETIKLISTTARLLGLDGTPIMNPNMKKQIKEVNDYGDPNALFDVGAEDEEEEKTETKGKFKVKK